MSSTVKAKARNCRLRRALLRMRLGFAAFLALILLALVGMSLFQTALLRNAYATGSALARSYADEEASHLSVYRTLLAFAAASVDARLSEGMDRAELLDWMHLYFDRMGDVLGERTADFYLVLDGEILAVHPWEGDASYDVEATEWYRRAMEAGGEIVFTDVYTDAAYHGPVITLAQRCGGWDAVLAFDLLLEDVEFSFDAAPLSESESFFLCDRTGQVIYSRTALPFDEHELAGYLARLIERIEAGEMDRYDAAITDFDGAIRAVYYARMAEGWYAIVTVPYAVILRDLYLLFWTFGPGLLLFLLLLILMTWRDMKANAQIDQTNETVRVLGNSYYALYRIDYGKSRYEMIKGSDYVRARIPPSGPYSELLRVAGEVIEPGAFEDFIESFSTDNIRRLVSQRVRDFGGEFQRLFDGEYRWVSVRVLFDESLAPEEIVLCFKEVDGEKQQQLRERKLLEDALELAHRNEAAKQTFFSSMSHDMRTPLGAILGLSELALGHTGDPEKITGDLHKIEAAGRQLLGLVNDILDMSRLEQGKVMVDNRQFDLRRCLEDTFVPFHIQAEREHKRFETDFQLRDTQLYGDPFRITQVFNNLLSNAFKFTQAGDTISVAAVQTDRDNPAQFTFTVADTGIGMTADYLPHLFEPYSREMRFGAKQTVGTGLGMPITQSLVTQMNGEIRVESAPGEGTTFTIVLPFAVAEPSADAGAPEAADAAETPLSLAGMRLLLAEDNEVNMEIATALLEMEGAEVTPAWNGAEAVDLFARSAPGTFDAILMDMQMPVMDGCTAARKIRAMSRPDAAAVPILAVTANAFSEDLAATTAAGMDAHISKPIDSGLLRQTLQRLLREGRG